MKTKNILGIFVSLLMLVSPLTMGQVMPHPVYGTITNNLEPVRNVQVNYVNANTGKTSTATTSSNGFYQFELGNFDTGFRDGDSLIVTVDFCKTNSKCSNTAVLSGGGNQIDIELAGVEDIPDNTPDTSVSSNDEETTASVDAYYYQDISLVIGNTKLAKLLDTEIEFDDEDYDVKEEVSIKGVVQTSLSDEDFGLNPYLVIGRGDIKYSYIFDDAIPLGDITEDEPLKITLFGENVEIIKASSTEITLLRGEVLTDMKEGETKEVNGMTLTVTTIGEGYIRVNYNGESATVDEEDTVEVGGLEVYLKGAYPDDTAEDLCDIRVGEDIEEVIEDNDDFDDDEIWNYEIDLPNSISLVNQEDYDDLDDDDFDPLAEGEVLVLPNDINIKFSEVTKPKMTDLRVEVDNGYLRLYGADESFNYGTDDFDEVLLKAGGIYDEDEVLISTDKIQIGDSDIDLVLGSALIKKLKIELDMSDILYDGVSFASKDGDYLDMYGIIFKDPENAIDDKDGFEISIPEERPEVTIIIGDEVVIDDEGCPICKEGTCPPATPVDCPKTYCPPPTTCPTQTCPTCQECQDCPTPEGGLGDYLIGLIGLALGGGLGIYFTKNKILGKNGGLKIYNNRAGVQVTYHKHPGILGYHDPKTQHRDINDRHPVGQMLPHYEKNEQGVYVYQK